MRQNWGETESRLLQEATERGDIIRSSSFMFQRIHHDTVPGLLGSTDCLDPFCLFEHEVNPTESGWFVIQSKGIPYVLRLPPEEEFYQTFLSREHPLVSHDSLASIRQTRIAVAGAGTVGGIVAQALARQGFGAITHGDLDTVSIHNLNRGVHTIEGIGINKTASLMELLFWINPYLEQSIFQDGVLSSNINDFLGDASIVISALDDVKTMCLLHEVAKSLGLPLILATDVDNEALFDLFDYRKPQTPLFNGRITKKDIGEKPENALIAQLVNPMRVSNKMLKAFISRVTGNIDYFPQRHIAALQSAALASEACLRLACGEDMRKTSRLSVARSLNTRHQVWQDLLIRPSVLYSLISAAKQEESS